MKLSFEKDLKHQTDAVNSVVKLFENVLEGENVKITRLSNNDYVFQNPSLDEKNLDVLFKNLRQIQFENGVVKTNNERDLSFSIEMETGTGKTYVYIKTILELFLKYNFKKFIIIVPSIAIKEGVLKSLEITKEHFCQIYGNLTYSFFEYDSKFLSRVKNFANSDGLSIMVLNVESFTKKTNIINQKSEAFNFIEPIEFIRETKPVVIVDESHNFQTEKRQSAIKSLNPSFVLNYSATLKNYKNVLFILDSYESMVRGLVKQIEVDSVFKYSNSDKIEVFKNQIERTIKNHLEKEVLNLKNNIKTLSLFFIDKVSNYRINRNGVRESGIIAKIFEEIYLKLIVKKEFEIVRNFYHPNWDGQSPLDFQLIHNGYFSQDTNGNFVDTKGESQKDELVYNLIMRDKEVLLSVENSLRFIFSHSALREGWDVPNVFNICNLNETKSYIKKRQEIGRGLRLCVSNDGKRVYDRSLNVLTIVTNDKYEEFLKELLKEYEEDGASNSFDKKLVKRREDRILIKQNYNFLNFVKNNFSIFEKQFGFLFQNKFVNYESISDFKLDLNDFEKDFENVVLKIKPKTNLHNVDFLVLKDKMLLESFDYELFANISKKYENVFLNSPNEFFDVFIQFFKKIENEKMLENVQFVLDNCVFDREFILKTIENDVKNNESRVSFKSDLLYEIKNLNKTNCNFVDCSSKEELEFVKMLDENDDVDFWIKNRSFNLNFLNFVFKPNFVYFNVKRKQMFFVFIFDKTEFDKDKKVFEVLNGLYSFGILFDFVFKNKECLV